MITKFNLLLRFHVRASVCEQMYTCIARQWISTYVRYAYNVSDHEYVAVADKLKLSKFPYNFLEYSITSSATYALGKRQRFPVYIEFRKYIKIRFLSSQKMQETYGKCKERWLSQQLSK